MATDAQLTDTKHDDTVPADADCGKASYVLLSRAVNDNH